MILNYIILENIRSYVSERIKFPIGSSLLSGDIGSGKSTILLAIEFALFGIKRKHLSASTLLRHGSNKGSVELAFTLANKIIIIKRNLTRHKHGIRQDAGQIIIDDDKTEGTPIELKSKIYELLGYPLELINKGDDLIFRYTVYTPQEEMKNILVDDSESRLDTLRRTFNIDKYKRIKDNASSYLTHIRQKTSECKGAISPLEEKKSSLNDIKQKVSEKNFELTDKKSELTTIKAKTEVVEEKLRNIEKKRNEITRLNERIKSSIEQLNEKSIRLKNSKSSIKELNEEIQEIDEKIHSIKFNEIPEDIIEDDENIEDEITKIESTFRETEQQKKQNQQELEHLNDRLDGINKDIDNRIELIVDISNKKENLIEFKKQVNKRGNIKETIGEIKKRIEKFNVKVHSIDNELNNIEKTVDDIGNLDNCPTCFQDVKEIHKLKIKQNNQNKIELLKKEKNNYEKDKELEIKRLDKYELEEEKLIEKEKKLEGLKVEVENLERINKEIDIKKKEIEPIENKIKDLSIQLIELNKVNTEKIKLRLDKLRSNISLIRQNLKSKEEKKKFIVLVNEKRRYKTNILNEIKSIESELEDLKVKLEHDKKSLTEFDDIESKYQQITKDVAAFREKLTRKEVEYTKLKTEIDGQNNLIDILNKDIVRMEKIKDNLGYLQQIENWLREFFIKSISSIEKQVMHKIHNEFNQLFFNWFKILIEDETINVRIDEEFTPIIEQNGYETDISNLSGGEKTSLALAYRLALNKVISGLIHSIKTKDLIILDEPTDGFSTDQLDRIRDVIDELNTNQVILVSHEPKMESYVDRIIKIEKQEHISRVI